MLVKYICIIYAPVVSMDFLGWISSFIFLIENWLEVIYFLIFFRPGQVSKVVGGRQTLADL